MSGSDDRFEVPVTWDARGIAESMWEIPKEAKQGTYTVSVLDRLDCYIGEGRAARARCRQLPRRVVPRSDDEGGVGAA